MKARCFFSHCWNDESQLSPFLKDYIKNLIEQESSNRIEVIFDKDCFKVSEDLLRNEKRILECDSIVVFCSPAYKTAVLENNLNRGVAREFQDIINVLKNENSVVIPIILEGNKENALPNALNAKIYENLSNVSYEKGKRVTFSLSKSDIARIKKLVNVIINKTETAFRLKPMSFENDIEKFENLLHITRANGKLPSKCMVKNDVYSSIISQTNYFVVGRKGSGKSTFCEVLEKLDTKFFDDKYKQLIPLKASDISLESFYSIITKHSRDLSIFSLPALLNVFWESIFKLYTIFILCIEEEHKKILDDRQDTLHKINNKLKRLLNVKTLEGPTFTQNIFSLCEERLDEFLHKSIIDFASEKAFISSIKANLTADNLMISIVGNANYKAFKKAIARCTKRIMLCMDGFDGASEDFRIATNNMMQSDEQAERGKQRNDFEIKFYRQMMITVSTFKEERKDDILDKVDFCLILPSDRIEQIRYLDRDFSKRPIADLRWDAIELQELLVLRLEEYYKTDDFSNLSMLERFRCLTKKHLPNLPDYVGIEVDGNNYKMDLFSYILRLSFWRPRDVLSHLAALLAASNRMDENRILDNETIKNILNRNATSIIEDEFLNEYNKVIINLKEILKAFSKQDVILKVEQVFEILSCISFVTSLSQDFTKIENKVKLLYDIGVLGILYPKTYAKEKGYGTNYCYIFNEGCEPSKIITAGLLSSTDRVKLIVNPIFKRYLSLNVNTKDILGNFGETYFWNNHSSKNVIRSF